MELIVERYVSQTARWPQSGRVVLAQADKSSVVVYQAYKRSIGHFAAEHGYFGGEFKIDRMTWIKPNFLWMMYRSGWGTKEDQEVTLAIRIERSAFEHLLAVAVPASYDRSLYSNQSDWKKAVAESDVRVQWDPDHDPVGRPLERKAIQLGLRGNAVRAYVRDWIVSIEDISDFVAQQRHNINGDELVTPREEVLEVDPTTADRHRIQVAD